MELLIFSVSHCFVLEGKFYSGNIKGNRKAGNEYSCQVAIDLKTLGREEEMGDKRTT